MTFDKFHPDYAKSNLLDGLLLLGVVYAAAAVIHVRPVVLAPFGGGKAPLTVSAAPQQAFAPLTLHVEVQQDVEAVEGRQVCLRVAGPEDDVSCWREDRPARRVHRTFVLRSPGEYEVRATMSSLTGGTENSNKVQVHVVGQ